MDPIIRIRPRQWRSMTSIDLNGLNGDSGRNRRRNSFTFLNPNEFELNEVNMENDNFGLPVNANAQNEIRSPVYKCMIMFGLYMLYESLIFLFLLSTGVLTHQFFTRLSESSNIRFLGVFRYIGTYHSAVHLCLLMKLLQDNVEKELLSPVLDLYFRGIPSFKCAYSWITLFMAGGSFMVLSVLFHDKYRVLNSGSQSNQIASSFYVISLSYIYYFSVVRCIHASERSSGIHQMVQNFLNVTFGAVIWTFSQLCGAILSYGGVKIKTASIAFALVTIALTLVFVYAKCVAFQNLEMGTGTKWAEILWLSLATVFLLKCYFEMNVSNRIDFQVIKFQTGISYLIYHSTRLVATDFPEVHLGL